MNTRRIYHVLLACVIILNRAPLFAQDAADADYSAELKRIPPTEPADALKTFEVIPGYKLELVTAEPLVTSPVAASFDEDGRLYVVEMRDYSEQAQEKLGRIRLLTDTDANGIFDKSEIFAEGLSWPTAVITYDGGIFVGAAPDIWYLKDSDHDGRADEKRIVFTGFGRGNVQGLLNSFTWGLDNRIHVAVSTAGAELQRVDETGKAQGKPLTLRGRDFCFDPRNADDFIATSGGGQHGMSFDDWGRKFVCSNSDHIQLIMLEDADLARNPYLVAPNPRISIALDGPQADVFRISPVEPWREVRTRLRVKGIVPGIVEGGGRAAGYFTGATGVTIYRGNAWLKEDRGLAIVGDVGSNLIHRKRLEPHGLELRAKRIDEKREFVASRDNWFRPVQFLNAPDGALYVLDMYRETIEHPASLPPVIKKHLDLTSGRDRGRIYRLVPEGFQQPPLPKLSSATTAELVALLEHENGWHRDTAARLIYEATDRAAIPALHKLVETGNESAQLHATYALLGVDGQVVEEVMKLRAARDPRLRAHAIRIARRQRQAGESVIPSSVFDPTGSVEPKSVCLELALSEGCSSGRRVASLLNSVDSPWVRTALLSGTTADNARLLESICAEPELFKKRFAHELLVGLARQVGRSDDPREFGPLLKQLPLVADKDLAAFQDIIIALNPAPNSRLLLAFDEDPDGRWTRRAIQHAVVEAWKTLDSGTTTVEARCRALQMLRFDAKAETVQRLLIFIDVAQPQEVQTVALATAQAIDVNAVASDLLARWQSLPPGIRRQAFALYTSTPARAEAMLAKVKDGDIPANDFTAAETESLLKHSSPAVRQAAEGVLRLNARAPRAEVVEAYRESLKVAGDKSRGAEHFKKQCSTCHKLGDVGKEIGPNLAAMKNRGAEAILVNVLDPNREVNPQFVTYTVVTKDGRTLSGMIAAETATSLTLRRGEGLEDTVLRVDIEELRSTGLSLMPEGLEKQLDQQQLADVIAFILGQ